MNKNLYSNLKTSFYINRCVVCRCTTCQLLYMYVSCNHCLSSEASASDSSPSSQLLTGSHWTTRALTCSLSRVSRLLVRDNVGLEKRSHGQYFNRRCPNPGIADSIFRHVFGVAGPVCHFFCDVDINLASFLRSFMWLSSDPVMA